MHHYGNNRFFSKELLKNKVIKTSDSTLQVFMTRKGKVGLRSSAAKKKLPELKEEIFPAEQEPIICQAFPWSPWRGALPADLLNSFRVAMTWLSSLGSSLMGHRWTFRAAEQSQGSGGSRKESKGLLWMNCDPNALESIS